MVEQLLHIENNIVSRDMIKARETCTDLFDYWGEKEKRLVLSLRHDYIEEIAVKLAKVKKMIEIDSEQEDILEEIEELRNIIVHIWHVEAPWIKDYIKI